MCTAYSIIYMFFTGDTAEKARRSRHSIKRECTDVAPRLPCNTERSMKAVTTAEICKT